MMHTQFIGRRDDGNRSRSITSSGDGGEPFPFVEAIPSPHHNSPYPSPHSKAIYIFSGKMFDALTKVH